MLFKIKKITKFYKYLILSFVALFFISIFSLIVLYFFPIKSTTSNLNNAPFSRFVSPWPTSALDQEILERKRLKRYARIEQKKRLEKQFQRMNVLNVPIYDLSLDDEAEILVGDSKYYPDKTDYLWPIFPLSRQFNNSASQDSNRRAVNLILPYQNWTSLFEGVYLSAGDEIKTNIPIIKERRYLNFLVFPLTPGNIRVILGQYVWAKTFGEEEVQKIQKVNIPINDPTAKNIRVLSISCSGYLLDMSINQIQRNGREPIKVAVGSSLWLPNKNYLINRFQEDNPQTEDDGNDSAPENIVNSMQETTDEPKNTDDNPPDSKPEESKQVVNDTLATKLNIEKNDPLLQTSNNQMLVNTEYSTAFGYNIVVIQTPPMDTDLIQNKTILQNVAPSMAGLMENSVFFDKNICYKQTNYRNHRTGQVKL
ncbi:MAG: hypothetical protein V4591_03555 [Bdellovibrionota bacterium]